jgi:hypothetical protein
MFTTHAQDAEYVWVLEVRQLSLVACQTVLTDSGLEESTDGPAGGLCPEEEFHDIRRTGTQLSIADVAKQPVGTRNAHQTYLLVSWCSSRAAMANVR